MLHDFFEKCAIFSTSTPYSLVVSRCGWGRRCEDYNLGLRAYLPISKTRRCFLQTIGIVDDEQSIFCVIVKANRLMQTVPFPPFPSRPAFQLHSPLYFPFSPSQGHLPVSALHAQPCGSPKPSLLSWPPFWVAVVGKVW